MASWTEDFLGQEFGKTGLCISLSSEEAKLLSIRLAVRRQNTRNARLAAVGLRGRGHSKKIQFPVVSRAATGSVPFGPPARTGSQAALFPPRATQSWIALRGADSVPFPRHTLPCPRCLLLLFTKRRFRPPREKRD